MKASDWRFKVFSKETGSCIFTFFLKSEVTSFVSAFKQAEEFCIEQGFYNVYLAGDVLQ